MGKHAPADAAVADLAAQQAASARVEMEHAVVAQEKAATRVWDEATTREREEAATKAWEEAAAKEGAGFTVALAQEEDSPPPSPAREGRTKWV